MANEVNSPYMSLPVPVAGVDPGPQFALDVNSCFLIVDQHDHTPGHGVLITPFGMNISSDLTFNNNNLTAARALRFQPQSVVIPPIGADIGELYEAGVDLYFNDGAGNTVRITQGGGVVGTPGSITGLVAPASASYNPSNSTFIWQSAANTPANLDAGFIILRDNVVNSPSCTLYPPTMATNQVLTLPLTNTTGQTAIMTMSTADAMGYAVLDNMTIVNNAGVIEVGPGSIGPTQLASTVGTTPTGAVLPYFGSTAPTNFVLCDGTSYTTSSQPALFAVIGYSCGGSGANFNVPDLRGQFLRGVTGSSANDPEASSRTAMNAGGNTGNNVGSVQGFETSTTGVSVGISDPGHHHIAPSGAASSNVPQYPYGGAGLTPNGIFPDGSDSTSLPFTQSVGTGVTASASGGLETRPINAYCNYIIKT